MNQNLLESVTKSNLVVITGITKSGKTTKALEIYTELCNDFQDCVFLYHDSDTQFIISKVVEIAKEKNIFLPKTSGQLISVHAMSFEQLLEMIENYEKQPEFSDKHTYFFIEDFMSLQTDMNRYDMLDRIREVAEKKNITVIVEIPYVKSVDSDYIANLKNKSDCVIVTEKDNCQVYSKF